MDTITCPHCSQAFEMSEALARDIEQRVMASERSRHQGELERVRAEVAAAAHEAAQASLERSRQQLAAEQVLAQEAAAAELALAKQRLEAEAERLARQTAADQELALKRLADDAADEKATSSKLRAELSASLDKVREAQAARDNAELEMQKRLAQEEAKIRDDATRAADERQRLNMAAKEKTITDLQKALEDAQRKAAQGSQQLQGEIMELDFEAALAEAFRDDLIEPVAKGVRGGDIRHVVRSTRGTRCGLMLWELKRTKHWTDSWTGKLKEDLRAEKGEIAIIITEALPKEATGDILQVDGVWVCKPAHAVALGAALRKSLVDVGRQRALEANRTTNAEALYNFVTSHEFVQQVEVMVETYREMTEQITKERVTFEKLWAQRDKQAQRLMLGTAAIIGSMEGHIGASSMPRIKGLDLLEG